MHIGVFLLSVVCFVGVHSEAVSEDVMLQLLQRIETLERRGTVACANIET